MINKQKKEPVIRFNGFTDTWEQREFNELVEQVIREVPKPDEPYYRMSVRSHAKGTFKQFVDDPNKVAMDKLYVVKKDDLVVNITFAWEHAIAVVSEDSAGLLVSHRFPTYRADEKSDIVFLKYLVSKEEFRRKLEFISPGGAGRNRVLNKKDFLKLKVMIPNIEEQQKIGSFFKQLDETIALQEHELLLLKEQKKSLLQKMFPKKGSKVPEMRFAEFTDDWEQHELGDYIIQFNEVTTENNQHPVFTSSRRGLFFQKDYYEGNQIASENNIGYNIVPRGYFTYRHMSDDLVFKFNINNLADYGIVSTLYPVFTTTEKMDSNYLQYHLNEGEEFRRFSILQKQGGSRTYMYLSKLKCLNLTVPIIEEQRMISSFFKQLDDTITLQESKLETLKNMKKSFLQKMFV
ncbi:restriction endonuclease subunit S [Vagococcus fluvialis]|uniref:restriction endonuclease subunit S n=1 Tax=Vagococcus fluvialis TaxID=2738 RepID=UPI003B5C8250